MPFGQWFGLEHIAHASSRSMTLISIRSAQRRLTRTQHLRQHPQSNHKALICLREQDLVAVEGHSSPVDSSAEWAQRRKDASPNLWCTVHGLGLASEAFKARIL